MDSIPANPIRQLPGGIVVEGELCKDYRFHEVTGALETGLGDLLIQSATYPEIVSRVLCRALASLCGRNVDRELVDRLSVGDRQFLVNELAALIDDGEKWLTVKCGRCEAPMDVSFRFGALPAKPCSHEFPEASVSTANGSILARAPNGADQCAIASIENENDALDALLGRLLRLPDAGDAFDIGGLSTTDRARVEDALEAMSPEVANALLAECPRCAAQNQVEVDAWGHVSGSVHALLPQVHDLASHYHWSEAEILTLPRERRLAYLQLIDKSRGRVGEEAGFEVGR